MPKIEFKRDILISARDRCALPHEEQTELQNRLNEIVPPKIHTAVFKLEEWPMPFWRCVLDDTRLSVTQRTVLARYVFGMNAAPANADELYQTEVTDPIEFGSTFAFLGEGIPNCELLLNGRWYPVIAKCTFLEDENKIAKFVVLNIVLSVCESRMHRQFFISRDLFLDDRGQQITRTVESVLRYLGLRQLQTNSGEFNLRLVKAERLARETGSLMLVRGTVLVASERFWWQGFESRVLGTAQSPRKVIVDAELEVDAEERHTYHSRRMDQAGESRLPFVRLFCLEIKRYIYADVDDLQPYEFDVAAIERLCLPTEMLSVLSRVFDTSIQEVFGDLIRGKHGGVVILASGKPGVGKTLTAEIYAEQTQRPLYVLEIGELGTTATEVEEQLRRVFARVTRWNAVLQFDECEIFLSKRSDDLERSAIVGIFLRLLDYYNGMLFLTSNRPQTIDDAVLSRVMLHLRYPDLTRETRSEVWNNMFASAGISMSADCLEHLAQQDVNGRQIRNLTRLAKILYPDGQLDLARMTEVLRFGVSTTNDSETISLRQPDLQKQRRRRARLKKKYLESAED